MFYMIGGVLCYLYGRNQDAVNAFIKAKYQELTGKNSGMKY